MMGLEVFVLEIAVSLSIALSGRHRNTAYYFNIACLSTTLPHTHHSPLIT